MDSAIDRKLIWNEGAKAGLIFGAIAIAYMVLTHFTAKFSANGAPLRAALISVLNLALWVGKVIGCILLMKALMKRFAAANPSAVNSDVFRYGVVTALLSAILYSGFYLAFVLFIQPDTLRDAMDAVIASASANLDSNSMAAIEGLQDKLPQLTFTVNLIWCFLFGTVLSAIFSQNIPSRNPFDRN